MKRKALFGHFRLLPAVIVLAGTLFAIKSVDLVQNARAEAAKPAATQAPAADTASAPAKDTQSDDPAVDDSSTSTAEVELLSSLSKRRSELDTRERALDMRSKLLAAAERRVDAKIADLKSLEGQIQTLLGHRDAAEQKQLTALVKVYSAMKPRDAARIFNTLDESVLLNVASAMRPDSLAAIMAAMNPKQAQDLTVKLANRLKLPKTPDLPAPAKLAAAIPAPAAPSASGPGSAAAAPAQPPAAGSAQVSPASAKAPAASGS